MKVVFSMYDGKNIINGINTWLIKLLPALSTNGYEIQIIAILWANEDDCTTLPILRRMGIRCTVVPYPHYTEDIVNWILKYFKKERPDIFVPGNMIPAIHASKIIFASGIPTIGVIHNDDQWHQAMINEFIIQPGAKYFSALVSVSSSLNNKASQLKKEILMKRIPCGGTISKKTTSWRKGQTFKVAYIGRIVQEQKQIVDVITQFCECSLVMPDTEYHVYGSGPEMDKILKIKNDYGNPKNVIIHGLVLNIEEILPSLHAIVLLSDYEGIPVALMEAMGCGVVPICKKIESGIPELVTNDQTGILIDQVVELPSAIKKLKSDIIYWSTLSKNSKDFIEINFSAQKNLSDWINLLESLKPLTKNEFLISYRHTLPQINIIFTDLDLRRPSFFKRFYKKMKRILTKNA